MLASVVWYSMGMDWLRYVVLCGLLSSGIVLGFACASSRSEPQVSVVAPPASEPPPRASQSTPEPVPRALRVLFARIDEIVARAVAAPCPEVSEAPSERALREFDRRFVEWFDARRGVLEEAVEEYHHHVLTTESKSTQAHVLWHAYETWHDIEESEKECLTSPDEKTSADRVETWKRGARHRGSQRAIDWLLDCVDLSKEGTPTKPWGERCNEALSDVKRRAKLEHFEREMQRYRQQLRGERYTTLKSNWTPTLTPTTVGPCEFSGWLHRTGRFDTESTPAFHIKDYALVRKLTLPSSEHGRYSVTIDWPLRGSFELAKDYRPLTVTQKVWLVPDHVWLGPSSRLDAHQAPSGQAALASPADFVTPSPPRVLVNCSILELASRAYPRGVAVPEFHDEPFTLNRTSSAASPDAVATVHGRFLGRVEVLSRRGELWRVRSLGEDYGVEGWVLADAIRTEPIGGFGMGSYGAVEKTYDFEVTTPLAVRVRPAREAQPIGHLPEKQIVRVWSERGEFVGVKVAHAYAENETGEFFVLRADLEAQPPARAYQPRFEAPTPVE